MKRTMYWSFLGIAVIGLVAILKIQNAETATSTIEKELKWYTLEEAMEANKKNPKKIFIDVYTEWCGWCKVMDKQTFTDTEVAAFLQKHYYPVKFDAEQKEAIVFKGKSYEFVKAGRRGVNTLAYQLLNGRLSYPSIVYLDENLNSIRAASGYKKPGELMPELKFAAEGHYKTVGFNDFMQTMGR